MCLRLSQRAEQNGHFILWAMTPMSNPCLPPEVFDYTVNVLYNNPKVLKKCCLAPKSWVSCARKHRYQVSFRR
jgi:hypothetical protein